MTRKCLPFAIAMALFAGSVTAQDAAVDTLRDAARRSVLENPEVLAAWREFQAAAQEVQVAEGGYYPRVDLEAGVGEERINDPRLDVNTFDRDRVSLNLSQMLFDGLATRNEVRRLNHAARTRYYEVLEISEQAAVESARAYFDVLRHRGLVSLSEENYATHRMIYDQIER
ncbi:MAG: TolC family protein, partial [Gammaproteobacteria bacterium]